MSKQEKLLQRLLQRTPDLAWNEAVTLMEHRGFKVVNGKGSRRCFFHVASKIKVFVHEPHPQPIVKKYVQELLIEGLQNAGEIDDQAS